VDVRLRSSEDASGHRPAPMKHWLPSLMILIFVLLAGTAASARPKGGLFGLHTSLGKKYYALKKYREAAIQFKAALAVEDSASAHFNLAQCYRFLKRYGDAIRHYEAFLEGLHSLKQFSKLQVKAFRKEVRARISHLQELQKSVERGAQSVAILLTPIPVPAPPAPLLERWPFWALAGAGAVTLAAAVVLGVKTLDKRDQWETYWLPEMRTDMERYRDYTDLSISLFALTAVTMGFYIYTTVLEKRRYVPPLRDRQITILPQGGNGQAGISLTVRF